MAKKSFAIAGSGEVDVENNAAPLLDSYIPQSIGAFFRPERVPRSNKSLSGVLDWLVSDDMLGAKGVRPSGDLVADLVASRDEHGYDPELIMLWPEEPSEEEIELVTRARAEGIPVKSLGDAIDDLLWEPEVEEEPAPEPEPETPAVAEPVKEQAPELHPLIAAGLSEQRWSALRSALEEVVVDTVQRYIGGQIAAAPVGVSPEPEAEDKPPFDGPYEKTPKFQAPPAGRAARPSAMEYLKTGDGPDATYRLAASPVNRRPRRPRANETRVTLTEEQIGELARNGKITD